MRLFRPLALFALTAGLAVLLGDATSAPGQTLTKQQKQELRAKRKAALAAEKAAAEEAAKAPAKPAPAEPTPAPPPAARKDATALTRLIDEQIGQKLAAAKVTPSPLCSDEEFLRRVYLDLTGVIPSADKASAFLDSTDPQKRARLIDELLDSPNYGRRLADLWQAKLLPRDSGNRFVLREPFVQWLAEQFNKNTPWDRFATELVTASGTVEHNPAVTFFLANRAVDKLTDTVAQEFMGIQLQCAQCHNHPFTEIKQAEYWGMAAFFSKVRPDNPRNANKGGDNTQIGVTETPQRTRAKDFFPESAKDLPPKYLGGELAKVTAVQPLRPALAHWLTAKDNPFFARATVNRTWGRLFGRGFVNPVDNMTPENPVSHPELLDRLAREFAAGGFDLKHLHRAICNSQTYQRSSKPAGANTAGHDLFSHMAVKVMTPEELFDSLAAVTGQDKAMAARAAAAGNPKRGPTGPRDQFVQFFLAGAESPNPAEYEAGIPQALRLMNSRVTGNPAVVRNLVAGADKPGAAIERIYLATLSRRPTAAELDRLTQYVAKAPTAAEAYSDIFWVVLNSSEFTMVK